MEPIKFDANAAVYVGNALEKCPFGALSFEDNGCCRGLTCRMCGMCVRQCPEKAISLSRKQDHLIKTNGKDFDLCRTRNVERFIQLHLN